MQELDLVEDKLQKSNLKYTEKMEEQSKNDRTS